MANDLVTRLTLNNREFENTLSKSTNQIKSFKTQSEAQSKSISAAFSNVAKAAGGIGIAFSSMEGVNKIIESSQLLTDEWNRTIESAKSSVDYFFSSLATGNWDNFIQGLEQSISKAKEAYNALDDLGTFNIFSTVEFSELDYKKNTQKTIIKDKNSTPEQVDNAQKELIKLQERQVELIQERSILEDNVYKKNVERLLAEVGRAHV